MVKNTKNELRKQMLQSRMALGESLRTAKSLLITKKILMLPIIQQAKVIACYWPLKSEVQTILLINELLKQKKTVLLPEVIADYNLHFYSINKKLVLNAVRTNKIPPNNNHSHKERQIDVIIVPLVVFDAHKARIGLGYGYYDRFLKLVPQAYKLGIAYKEQKYSGKIPVESHDVKLDKIIAA